MIQKFAAIILGILGLGIILSSNTITGGVIGTNTTNPLAFAWGITSLALGILLWFKRNSLTEDIEEF